MAILWDWEQFYVMLRTSPHHSEESVSTEFMKELEPEPFYVLLGTVPPIPSINYCFPVLRRGLPSDQIFLDEMA